MHLLGLTRTCLFFLQNQHVKRILHGGKSYSASCSYCSTILWHNLSVWFLIESHWLIHKLILKNLSSHYWQEWIELWLCNTEVEHMRKRKCNCQTNIADAPNQSLIPLIIHSNAGQDHIMHIFLYLILTVVGVGVSEIKLLKYGMPSALHTVLISNTTVCTVCQHWPVSTACCIVTLGTTMGTGAVKFCYCHMKKEAPGCLRVARANRRKNSILVHLLMKWQSCLLFPHILCDSYSLPILWREKRGIHYTSRR
jgi:hypothetical protein